MNEKMLFVKVFQLFKKKNEKFNTYIFGNYRILMKL